MENIKAKSIDSNYKLIDLLKFVCAFLVIGIHTRLFQAVVILWIGYFTMTFLIMRCLSFMRVQEIF